jgi:hypothetical protein
VNAIDDFVGRLPSSKDLPSPSPTTFSYSRRSHDFD